jgi:hypothetical protein
MTHEQREIHRKKRILEYAERIGNINKTCRYFGVARSTRCAAVSAILRPPHEGQNPRHLHEKATSRSCPHASQWTRKNPWASTPHSRYARISRSTNRATGAPCSRARARKGSSCSRTTSWRRVFSGSWRSYWMAARNPLGPWDGVLCQRKQASYRSPDGDRLQAERLRRELGSCVYPIP